MKIKEILLSGKSMLEENIEESSLKVKIILSELLNKTKEYLIIHDDEEVEDEISKKFFEHIERLKNNEPIQYIINKQSFFGLDFYINENVLIPQPDTEILVEECINILQDVEKGIQEKSNIKEKHIKILDLCTGSGAIGISIAKNIKETKIYVSDISKKALEIAKKNAIENGVEITFIESDLFENINDKFFMIVSNPPYIETKTIESLPEEVKREPMLALDGGEDGLRFYREIAKQSKEYLEDAGYLALEIGYNQRFLVEEILKENHFKNIYYKKDLGGNDRIIIAQK